VNKPQEIYHAFMIKNNSQFICIQQSFMFVVSFFVFICILVFLNPFISSLDLIYYYISNGV
jgi:hypothetical protein